MAATKVAAILMSEINNPLAVKVSAVTVEIA
jgi:hypothetical protein